MNVAQNYDPEFQYSVTFPDPSDLNQSDPGPTLTRDQIGAGSDQIGHLEAWDRIGNYELGSFARLAHGL